MTKTGQQSRAYTKGYKSGYNNPGHFDHLKLLASNGDVVKGIIDGLCQRKADQSKGQVKFILS